jgi:hypothetical protein
MVAALVIIPLLIVVAVLFFYLGVRYTARSLLPSILARMDPKELGELAKKAAAERPD